MPFVLPLAARRHRAEKIIVIKIIYIIIINSQSCNIKLWSFSPSWASEALPSTVHFEGGVAKKHRLFKIILKNRPDVAQR